MKLEDELNALRYEVKYGRRHSAKKGSRSSVTSVLSTVGIVTAIAAIYGVVTGNMTNSSIVTMSVVAAATALVHD